MQENRYKTRINLFSLINSIKLTIENKETVAIISRKATEKKKSNTMQNLSMASCDEITNFSI